MGQGNRIFGDKKHFFLCASNNNNLLPKFETNFKKGIVNCVYSLKFDCAPAEVFDSTIEARDELLFLSLRNSFVLNEHVLPIRRGVSHFGIET